LATIQRTQLQAEIAEARPRGNVIWLPIAAIILLLIIIAISAYLYL
jgi:hypothetical protein